ncbi:MAG: PAS domain S-box protein, partial [Pseudomonadota bacterium]
GHNGLRSLLIVPLMAKGEPVGTLGVGARSPHQFPPDEVDLLRAIGDQIGMAMENSRLYGRERQAADALRASESNYRELFENASDAIWVHDLNGRVLAANNAFERLTGHRRDALVGANVSLVLPPCGLTGAGQAAHNMALRGEAALSYEQELVRKDGSTVVAQIGTSLITRGEDPWAFQHIARDVTEEKRVQDNLKFYVQRVSQAQEAERKRIARELHDETAQALVTVIRNLGDLASNGSAVSAAGIQEQVREILRGVRQFSQQLRPSILDDLGLVPALKWLASELNGQGIGAHAEITGNVRQILPEAELTLFRIAQEGLNNARRHAGASRVDIRLEFAERSVRMTVSDDGKGFDLPARVGDLARVGKLGLAGMQERAQLLGGTLLIDSAPGKGTKLTVEVPL